MKSMIHAHTVRDWLTERAAEELNKMRLWLGESNDMAIRHAARSEAFSEAALFVLHKEEDVEEGTT